MKTGQNKFWNISLEEVKPDWLRIIITILVAIFIFLPACLFVFITAGIVESIIDAVSAFINVGKDIGMAYYVTVKKLINGKTNQ